MRNIWASSEQHGLQAGCNCGILFSIFTATINSFHQRLVIQSPAFKANVNEFIWQTCLFMLFTFLYYEDSTFCTHQGLGKFTLLVNVSPELLWSASFHLRWWLWIHNMDVIRSWMDFDVLAVIRAELNKNYLASFLSFTSRITKDFFLYSAWIFSHIISI